MDGVKFEFKDIILSSNPKNDSMSGDDLSDILH